MEPGQRPPTTFGRWIPWLVALLALLLRFDGLAFGLDPEDVDRAILNNNIDERGMVEAVQRNFLHGNLDPGSFAFRGPGGFVLFGLADLALVGTRALSAPGGFVEARRALEENPSLVFLTHRTVNALAGVLTVLLLAHCARREFGERCALFAGLFLAAAYAHARDSHYGTVDVLWALPGLYCLDRILLWSRAPAGRGRLLGIGLALGVAFACKYHAVFLTLPLAAAAWFRGRGLPLAQRVRGALAALLGVGGVALGAFLVLAPGLFVAPETFRSIVGFQVETNTAAAGIAEPLRALVFHLRYSLWTGLGEPVFALTLVGGVVGWRRGGAARSAVVAALLMAPILVATAAYPVRYTMGLMPLAALLAAFAFEALTRRWPRPLVAALTVLVLLPSLVRILTLNRLLPRPDTRPEMLAVLRAKAVAPEEILAFGTHHGLPRPTRRGERLFTTYASLLLGGQLKRGELRIDPQFEAKLEALLAAPPRWILWDLTREELVIPGKERVAELVRTRYRESLRLDGRKSDFPLPDLEEDGGAHMIPFAKPWTMSRPGPPLVLYERID